VETLLLESLAVHSLEIVVMQDLVDAYHASLVAVVEACLAVVALQEEEDDVP
jgi:hypothetical protein